MHKSSTNWLDTGGLKEAVSSLEEITTQQLEELVAKSLELEGLTVKEVALLTTIQSQEHLESIFSAAKKIKEVIYGKRIVLFAPLYISNLCKNECLYCAFRRSNTQLTRRALNREEIQAETINILDQGHKRVLMVAGESYPKEDGFSYVIKAIDAIYAAKNTKGDTIRRVNVNVAPLTLEQFKELKDSGIGTYQLFQETYHRETYAKVHASGQKSDFDWRLSGIDRAMQAGIEDVGIGVLLGLADWRYDLVAMLGHVQHLEKNFGMGCHTISVPRIEPAVGSEMASSPPSPVSDQDFKKIIAILRMAVPYTGIILSTRENEAMRNSAISLGVSQISAGSCTDPGGYSEKRNESAAQFTLGDHRSLAEMAVSLNKDGYIPSFCTGCYRTGRTGHDFMELAKPGAIKAKCGPNALSTYLEYLLNYTDEETRKQGRIAIENELATMTERDRARATKMLDKVEQGERDIFC